MNKTYVAFVLDRSGSMGDCRSETIRGFNEHVDVIREEAQNHEYFVSLVTFNGKVDPIFFNAKVESLQKLTEESYDPKGGTAMLDAVGFAISRLCQETDPDDEYNSYLVNIFSDGEENASQEWDELAISRKIQKLRRTNRWTFAYIGANQDLSIVKNMNIPVGNIMPYNADPAGTTAMFATNASNLRSYMKCRAQGQTAMENFCLKDTTENKHA
jgi:uncharacterized protein YegL